MAGQLSDTKKRSGKGEKSYSIRGYFILGYLQTIVVVDSESLLESIERKLCVEHIHALYFMFVGISSQPYA